MIRFFDLTVLFLYCILIYWLSDQPHIDTPMWFAHQDKIFHATAYFIMALFAWRVFRHFSVFAKLWAFIFCSVYGISDEWHQSFVPGRFPDTLDWVADSMGSGIALILLPIFIRMLGSFRSKMTRSGII